MERFLIFIENNTILLNGFVTTGVVLILIGVKNVTSKEINDLKLIHEDITKIDETLAWGIFYIIFGLLITAGAIASLGSLTT